MVTGKNEKYRTKCRKKAVTCDPPLIITNITESWRRSRTVITNRLLNIQEDHIKY